MGFKIETAVNVGDIVDSYKLGKVTIIDLELKQSAIDRSYQVMCLVEFADRRREWTNEGVLLEGTGV
jgi:hypothetical protein